MSGNEYEADSNRDLCGAPGTGIFVRAKRGNGGTQSVDIAELKRGSLLAWLRSRDGEPDKGQAWRESVILIILGHPYGGEQGANNASD